MLTLLNIGHDFILNAQIIDQNLINCDHLYLAQILDNILVLNTRGALSLCDHPPSPGINTYDFLIPAEP